jgi:hypothetical protein
MESMDLFEQVIAKYEAARARVEAIRAKVAGLRSPDKATVRHQRVIENLDRKTAEMTARHRRELDGIAFQREQEVIKLGWAKDDAPAKSTGRSEKLALELTEAERLFAIAVNEREDMCREVYKRKTPDGAVVVEVIYAGTPGYAAQKARLTEGCGGPPIQGGETDNNSQ